MGTLQAMNSSEITASTVEPTDFLVIGAGLAGLAFARDAQKHGKTVRVLDKGRGIGGRMATRRFGEGLRVDHGAQFFTARGTRFQEVVDAGLENGTVIEWSRGFPEWKNGEVVNRPPGHARYACPSGMSDLPKTLAQTVPVETGAQVVEITRTSKGSVYQAVCADGRVFAGAALMLCLPPVQLLSIARPLLPADTVAAIDAVTYDPAWTLIAQLENDLPGVNWPAVEFSGHPVLGWVSRDHTKRPGPNAPPVLVAHGSGNWSRAHLEDEPAAVQATLLGALTDVFGPLPNVVQTQTHRWRYANPTHLLGTPFFWDAQTRIGGGGDWAGGGNVEGALTSGWELARAVLADG